MASSCADKRRPLKWGIVKAPTNWVTIFVDRHVSKIKRGASVGTYLLVAAVNRCVAARSHHPGGAEASLCDGSVRFFSASIDLAAWRALASARGSETVHTP